MDVDCESEHSYEENSISGDENLMNNVSKKVYLPEMKLNEGEELVVDETAYRIFQQAQTGAPCLSFDIITDNLKNFKETYPLSINIVAGTQAARTHINNLLIVKMFNIHGISAKYNSDESNSSDEETDEKLPKMNVSYIKHQGSVNRVRCINIENTTLVASWSELGHVSLWDISEQLMVVGNDSLQTSHKTKNEKNSVQPIYTFKGHLSEGYGIDWCPTDLGTLATGDCKGNIHIWRYADNGGTCSWHVDQRPYNSHAPHSVEDLQWKPDEKYVLASCSVDKSIKIWDTRINPQTACILTVSNSHSSDVNVISWNKKETQFIISGGDEGALKVWDLRQCNKKGASPVAIFKQHRAPVTTVEWYNQEASVFASGGADNVIYQWDLSVEADVSESDDEKLKKLPPQLLFIHQGQTDVKELHWHPQYSGVVVSTANSGFNVFRTISI